MTLSGEYLLGSIGFNIALRHNVSMIHILIFTPQPSALHGFSPYAHEVHSNLITRLSWRRSRPNTDKVGAMEEKIWITYIEESKGRLEEEYGAEDIDG